jgi:hypothetical protein
MSGGPVVACFELRNDPIRDEGASLVLDIQVVVNPNSYPFAVEGGSLTGIPTAPGTSWVVVEGGHFGADLEIRAIVQPFQTQPVAAMRGAAAAERGAAAGGELLVTPGLLSEGVVTEGLSEVGATLEIMGTFQVPDSYVGRYSLGAVDFKGFQTTLFKGWQACS